MDARGGDGGGIGGPERERGHASLHGALASAFERDSRKKICYERTAQSAHTQPPSCAPYETLCVPIGPAKRDMTIVARCSHSNSCARAIGMLRGQIN